MQEMAPPWIEYPHIDRYSIGWRMGEGEWYIGLFDAWFKNCSKAFRDDYAARFPPPTDWEDFLALVPIRDSGSLPLPWVHMVGSTPSDYVDGSFRNRELARLFEAANGDFSTLQRDLPVFRMNIIWEDFVFGFAVLSSEEQSAFAQANPEPPEWRGIYKRIAHAETFTTLPLPGNDIID